VIYDWDAPPAGQDASGRAFWRGAVFGALIEAVLILAAVWALWGVFG
jgi:hypothetical protein